MGLGLTKSQYKMIAILLCGTLLAVLNMTLLTPALPTIMRETGVASSTVQWLTSGYAMVEAVVIPLAAYMMGRFSTRKLFVGGISLFAVGSIVAACAPSFWFIFAGRVIQAACTGVIMPMVSSVILLIFPREKRGSAMGVVGLIIGFAPAIGPSLSGVIVDHLGWRALFAIVAVLALIVALVAFKELENFGNFERTPFDVLSVVLSTVGLVCLLYGLSEFGSAVNIALPLCLVVVGIAVIGVYARRQLALEEPMLRLSILKTRKYRTVVVVVALFQAGLVGMETIMPMYIQNVLGESATVSGLTLLPGALIGAFVGLIAGRLFDRRGVRFPTTIGCTAIAVAAVGFVLLRVDSPIAVVSVTYACMVFGVQFTMGPLNTWGINSLSNDNVRHAQSTQNTVNQVAGSFGTAALVSVSVAASSSASQLSGAANTFFGYHASFICTAVLLFAAIAFIFIFVRDRKTDASQIAQNAHPHRTDDSVSVADAMNAHAACVRETASMYEVMRVMEEADTSGVTVVDDKMHLVGFVTDGDIARYLARTDIDNSNAFANVSAGYRDSGDFRKHLADLAKLNVMSMAVTNVITFDESMPLDAACKVLVDKRIKKAPVLRDGVVVGSLSRKNVTKFTLDELDAGTLSGNLENAGDARETSVGVTVS